MIWRNFFTVGGLGMYPISVHGFLLLASALLLALRPERRFVPLVVSLALLTLGSGVLGTLVGIVTTFHYVARTPAGQVQWVSPRRPTVWCSRYSLSWQPWRSPRLRRGGPRARARQGSIVRRKVGSR